VSRVGSVGRLLKSAFPDRDETSPRVDLSENPPQTESCCQAGQGRQRCRANC
jgi:hypothetical protein